MTKKVSRDPQYVVFYSPFHDLNLKKRSESFIWIWWTNEYCGRCLIRKGLKKKIVENFTMRGLSALYFYKEKKDGLKTLDLF